MFQLEFSSREVAGKRITVTNRDTRSIGFEKKTNSGQTIGRVRFAGVGGQAIEVVCTITAGETGDRLVRWRIAVQFPESLVLEGVRFPILSLRTPISPHGEDALVLGTTKGGVYRRPSAWKLGRSASAVQPGNLAAQFGCYYDDKGGLYTAALDAHGYRKMINTWRGSDSLTLAWYELCFSRSRHAQDYDIVVGVFGRADSSEPADWRDAADLYKTWARQQSWCARTFIRRNDLPGWLREGPAMVRFGREWLGTPEAIESWLKQYWKEEFPARVPLVIAYWGWEKVATWVTPDYFPVYPSDEQFRSLVETSRRLGGHTFLWPSGYHYTLTYGKRPDGTFLWDDRDRFQSTAAPHAVCRRDGKVEIGDRFWLQGGQSATMCCGDPWTIDWFNRLSVGLAEQGAELIQVDQVVGGGTPICYSTRHGHPPGSGCWATDAFHRQLQTMLQACREVQPDAVVCFEEPNEHFIQEVGIQDYRDWEVMGQEGVEPASVFNYLYHEYLPTFQSNPRAGDRLMAAYCMVNGQIPHLVPSPATGPGPLLVNGSMETWKQDVPAGWDKVEGYRDQVFSGKAYRDENQRHGGRASLCLVNRKPDEMVQVSQNVEVGGTLAIGRTYRVSAWMKTTGLDMPNGIMLGTFTKQIRPTGSWRIAMPPKQSDWTRGEATFTVPEGSELLRIMLHVTGRGTVWLDDLKLEEILADRSVVEVQRPDKPQDHRLMHRWVELFHGDGQPYLLLGRMLHPPKLEVRTCESHGRRFPAILHNAFAAPDGSKAVVLVNPTTTPQTGKLTWGGKTISVRLDPDEATLLREERGIKPVSMSR